MSDVTRRTVLRGAAAGAAVLGAAPVLAACGDKEEDTPAAFGPVTVDVADVPVGHGKLYKDQNLFVTQPEAGQYHAFDARCPHQNCPVDKIVDGQIACPCHNTRFDVSSGARLSGPAKSGLRALTVTVEGTSLTAKA